MNPGITHSIKRLILVCVLATHAGIARGADDNGIEPDAAYEQKVNGRIAVDYYNQYLQEIVVDARGYLADELTKTMGRLDKFVAEGNFDGGAPGFPGNWRNAKGILTLPTRVPNWYSAADQKLFKGGIDQLRNDTGELFKICEDLQKYFQYNGGWKEDKCRKYTGLKSRMQTLVASVKKNADALDGRALEMAVAGEKLYWEQDKALGYFVRTMKADVDHVHAIDALIKNPGLQKEGGADAAATLPKIENLLGALKESLEKNTALGTPALTEKLKQEKDRFYSHWLKDYVEAAEKYILPGLKKGILKESDIDRVNADNIGRRYDDFIDLYTYGGGIAIKYKRP
jgi:hypothetical protein